MRKWSLMALGLILSACNETDRFAPDLKIIQSHAVLREAPGESGKELRSLPERTKIQSTGQVSDFVTPLQFDDTLLEAPWIRIRTQDGKTGWIYALDAEPLDGEVQTWRIQQNFSALLGSELSARTFQWKETAYKTEKDASGQARLSDLYHQMKVLKADITYKLSNRPKPYGIEYEPNLAWLPGELPGMVFEWPAEPGAPPIPRVDYRYLLHLAEQKNDGSAVTYFSFCASVFPIDSIESPFPTWKMPLSATESCSRLGTGNHETFLHRIDSLSTSCPEFKQDLTEWKNMLLEDILGKNITFWYSAAQIRSELERINLHPASCLEPRDRMALIERLRQFENPEANRLQTDLRSGRLIENPTSSN